MAPGNMLPSVSTRMLGSTSCTPKTNGCCGLFSMNGAPNTGAPAALAGAGITATGRVVSAKARMATPLFRKVVFIVLSLPFLSKLNAAREQGAANRIAVAQCQADAAYPGEPVDSNHGEGDRRAVVCSGAEDGHLGEGIVERDPRDPVGLEVVAGLGIVFLDRLGVCVLASVLVESHMRGSATTVRDVALPVALVARARAAIIDGGLEVVTADAVDLEWHCVRLGRDIVLSPLLDRG